MTIFLLLLGLMQASPSATPGPDPEARNGIWGTVENSFFRATKDDVTCGAVTNPGCRDRVIVALGDIVVKSGGTTKQLKRGQIAVFGAGQSYERPTGERFWEIAIKSDHPPVPSPKEVVQPTGDDVMHEGEDFWIYNEKLMPGETRPRHSHTMRAVVQLNAGVGAPGGVVMEWPAPEKPSQPVTKSDLKLTPAQREAILKNPPKSNDSIAMVGPVIHTNTASEYGPLDGIVVMMKTADEKAGRGKPAFNHKK